MQTSIVAVQKTRPETVFDDYSRVMELAAFEDFLPRDSDTLVKLNLSWTKYFPACSSQPCVRLVRARALRPHSLLRRLDLPTLERPASAISGRWALGTWARVVAAAQNSALPGFI